MPKLSIRKLGDPVLRKRAKDIAQIDAATRQLAVDMFEALDEAEGVGLAANQVGVPVRLIVLSIPDGDERTRAVIVNPEKTREEGECVTEEGCLSIPGISEEVNRADFIEVIGMNLEGKPVTLSATGLLSRALQHEIDHLDGILFIDRLSMVKRQLLRKQLDEIAVKTREALSSQNE